MHNYSIIQIKSKNNVRSKINICIGIVSVSLSSILNSAIGELMSIAPQLKNITISGTPMLLAGGLYFLTNKFIWKMKLFKFFFKIPDLNGNYNVNAYNTDKKMYWSGKIKIVQTLEDICIYFEGNESKSNSTMANITYKEGIGYELNYTYENIRIGQQCSEIREHDGECSIVFDENITQAEGGYYTNPKDRISYGTIKLNKIQTEEVAECTQ